jgi:hypothetical protein
VSSYSSAQTGWTHAQPHATNEAAKAARRLIWFMSISFCSALTW